MKNKILLSIVIILSLILFAVVRYEKLTNYYFPMQSVEEKDENPITIRLLDEKTDNIQVINLEDYIIGVVSAEMPISFEVEALKAQALAARTYALYKKQTRNLDYDLVIGVKDQAYKNNGQLLKQWGLSFWNNYYKIRNAVLETKNQIITYENELINAFYFSMSNGKTENSELVFVSPKSYLISVSSPWDNESLSNFFASKTIPKEEFCSKLDITCDVINITNEIRSDSGRILNTVINNKQFKGTEVRALLNLRSTDFEIHDLNDQIIINTKGYGHGVGMSQYGANGMAKEKYTYEQIIKHYYQNTEIKQFDSIK